MKLRVTEWHGDPHNFHVCTDEDGKTHRVDLFVNGDISDVDYPAAESCIGRTFEVDDLRPYVEIAYGVREVTP
jgi:hypothetical protein